MGFDVLAFESGMFDMRWVDEGMRNGAPLTEVHQRGFFGIGALWSQCQDLLKYVLDSNSTESPLELAGFDSQFSSGFACKEFPGAVKLFFGKPGEPEQSVLAKEQESAAADLAAWIEKATAGAKAGNKAQEAMADELLKR